MKQFSPHWRSRCYSAPKIIGSEICSQPCAQANSGTSLCASPPIGERGLRLHARVDHKRTDARSRHAVIADYNGSGQILGRQEKVLGGVARRGPSPRATALRIIKGAWTSIVYDATKMTASSPGSWDNMRKKLG